MASTTQKMVQKWARRPKGCALSKPHNIFAWVCERNTSLFYILISLSLFFSIKFLKTKFTLRPNLNLVFEANLLEYRLADRGTINWIRELVFEASKHGLG